MGRDTDHGSGCRFIHRKLESAYELKCDMNKLEFAGFRVRVRIRVTVWNNSCNSYEVLERVASMSSAIRDGFL